MNQTVMDFDAPPRFPGPSLTPADQSRLAGQQADILDLMRDSEWRTLEQIHAATGHPPASVSAQLRHLRKPKFGGHTVNKRHDDPDEGGTHSDWNPTARLEREERLRQQRGRR